MNRLLVVFCAFLSLTPFAHATKASIPLGLQISFGPVDRNGERSLHIWAVGLSGCSDLRLRVRGIDGAVPQDSNWKEIPCSGPLATVQMLVYAPPTSLLAIDIDMHHNGKRMVETRGVRPPDAPPRRPIVPPRISSNEYSSCRNLKPIKVVFQFSDSADMYDSIADGTFHMRLGGREAELAFWDTLSRVGGTTGGVFDLGVLVCVSYCLFDKDTRKRWVELYGDALHADLRIHPIYIEHLRRAGK